MSYILKLTDDAIEDVESLKKVGDKAVLKKLGILLQELSEHPRSGKGQPEELKYIFSGCWSRRITNKHRLVYTIEEDQEIVIILYARGHYTDK